MILREEENFIDNKKLVCGKTDWKIYDFTVFKNPIKFASVIFNKGLSKDAKDSQNEMLVMLNYLKNYNPKNLKNIKSREGTLINARIFYDARNKVINAFEDGVFPFEDGFWKEKLSDKTDETKLDLKELKLDKIPEWIQGSKEDVKRIIKDVVENLDSKNYTANVGGTNYNLKEAENFLLDIFTKDIDENVANKLYKNLIKPSTDILIVAPDACKEKRMNIINVLNDLESVIFDSAYLNYQSMDKSKESDTTDMPEKKSTRTRIKNFNTKPNA